MAKKKIEWEMQFRVAIEQSGMSLKEIARKSDVDDSQLSRFLRGERTFTLPTAERIARVIRLELNEIRK